MSPHVTVRIPRIFEGARHDRLRAIWDAVAEHEADHLVLKWFNNSIGLNHDSALNAMWERARAEGDGRTVFTEHDFLPDLNDPDWLLQRDLDDFPETQVVGVCYAKRRPGSRKVVNFRDTLGAWFMSFDVARCPPDLRFEGMIDPATDVMDQLGHAMLHPGLDSYPAHVGLEYPFGTHLFWSRHLHDDPRGRVSGYSLREIQQKHDEIVDAWIQTQPATFQAILARRSASAISASSSACTDGQAFYSALRAKLRGSSSRIEDVLRF